MIFPCCCAMHLGNFEILWRNAATNSGILTKCIAAEFSSIPVKKYRNVVKTFDTRCHFEFINCNCAIFVDLAEDSETFP